ncbi:RNA-directed DNA polymerase, eukaryota, partial [Tanacetum coccineum]
MAFKSRSNADHTRLISKSIFITNFPDVTTSKDLWVLCQSYGTVVDVFIPNRMSKAGKRFAFVRFIKVDNVERLVGNLCTLLERTVFLIRAKELFVWSPSFKEVLEVVHCSDDESVKNEADINVVDNTVNNEGEESDSEQSSRRCIRSHHNSDRCSSRVFEEVEKSDINIQSDGRVIRDIRKEGGSILDIFDEMIKVGQTMGFTMDGCTKDMEKIIGSNGDDASHDLSSFYADDVILLDEWSKENLKIGDSWSIVSEAAASLGCSVMKTPFNYLGIIVGGAADNSSSIGFLGSTPIYNMFMKLRSRRQFLTKSGKPSKEFFSMVFKKMIVKITWVLLAKSFLPRILQHGILINQKSFNLPQCQGVDVFSKLARLGLLNGLHNSFGRSYGTVIALLTEMGCLGVGSDEIYYVAVEFGSANFFIMIRISTGRPKSSSLLIVVALCSWSEGYAGELIQRRRLPVTALHCEDG